MKIEDSISFGKLFDAYGKLLSPSQQEIIDCYLNFDLTISEIAENKGVSRQAVKDALQKGEKRLTEIENLLGLVQKIDTLERQIKTKN